MTRGGSPTRKLSTRSASRGAPLRYYARELRVLPSYTIGRKVRFLGKDLREFFATMRQEPIDLDAL